MATKKSSSEAIELKTKAEIELMGKAGQLAARALRLVEEAVHPGVTTAELDRIAHDFIVKNKGTPAFLGYRGYPRTICASINDEVVHGIPGPRVLKSGDIVGVDVGVTLEGFVGDTAATFAVGQISPESQRLLDATREALAKGIGQARSGNRLGDISWAIQSYSEGQGFSVVRDFVGHGIGRKMHEEPAVPNYGQAGTGLRLLTGLVLALEPMLTAGGWQVRVLDDGWTVVTKDGSWSAHFEHTVAITENGPEILTIPE